MTTDHSQQPLPSNFYFKFICFFPYVTLFFPFFQYFLLFFFFSLFLLNLFRYLPQIPIMLFTKQKEKRCGYRYHELLYLIISSQYILFCPSCQMQHYRSKKRLHNKTMFILHFNLCLHPYISSYANQNFKVNIGSQYVK